MEVDFNKAYEMTQQHNIETNVDHTIKYCDIPEMVLQDSLNSMQQHPELYNVSISHPLITFHKFVRSMKTYKYYIQNKAYWNNKGLFMVWIPCINDLIFFRSYEQMDKFMQNILDKKNNKTFYDLSAESNIEDITLFTKGFEIKYRNGKEYCNLFDVVKGHDNI